MKTVTIMQGQRYSLDSSGNGWAYTLRDSETRQSVWLQDDDAAQFREELETLESRFPNHSTDAILGMLWFDFEYGRVASDD